MTTQDDFTCKNCPDWEVLIVDGEIYMADEKTRAGRCKANYPGGYKFGTFESNFPIAREDDWCRPGRDAMKAARVQPTNVQLATNGYDEF